MLKKIIYKAVLLVIVSVSISFGQQKWGQTGLQFLSVSTDGRAAAMGQAMTSLSQNSLALFYNPASMGKMKQFIDGTASQNNWFADMQHNAFSIAISPANGRFGVIGATLKNVDYGEIQGTVIAENDQGYQDTEIYNPSSIVAGLGYAKSLNDKFSVGGQLNIVAQQLGKSIVPEGEDSSIVKDNVVNGVSFDFGTIYKTGFKSLAFGMSVRNFSGELKYEDEGFQLPLTFTMGISMNLFDLINEDINSHSLLFAIDALHYRSHPEQINIGLEYALKDMFFIRCGYRSAEELHNLSYGFGIKLVGLNVDYAYTPFGVFDSVQRFTIGFSI
ncbi:MAG: PorV/PorQ family protein [Candidatus Marinimicrobia bacterium]|nr:PorV/PorQ family protein [Candidatus Neomarinimicrobiota bacterium]